jgi:phage host-nuclease inhibitor protein Gam
MQLKEAYLQQAVMEVEDLLKRVAALKARMAKQKVSVTVEHRAELDYVRHRFADFKRRIEELAQAGEENLEEAGKASELARKDLQHAVAALSSALP